MGNIKDGERTGKWLLRCIISALAIIGIGKITCQSKDIYILLGREWKSKTSPGMAKLLAPDSKDGRAGWISSSHHMFKGSIYGSQTKCHGKILWQYYVGQTIKQHLHAWKRVRVVNWCDLHLHNHIWTFFFYTNEYGLVYNYSILYPCHFKF